MSQPTANSQPPSQPKANRQQPTANRQSQIWSKLNLGKAVVLFGARQTGKTTLLKKIVPEDDQTPWLSGDNSDTQQMLSSAGGKRDQS